MMKRSLKILICAAALIVLAIFSCSADAVEAGTVNAESGLRLRTAASTSAGTVSILPNGSEVIITEAGAEWCKVSCGSAEGYMSTEYLTRADTAAFETPYTGKVTASVVNLRAEANTTSTVLGQLVENSEVVILGVSGGWYHVLANDVEGFIHPDYVVPTAVMSSDDAAPASEAAASADAVPASSDVSDLRERLIAFAKQYIGTRYTYGGRSPSTGFDCSGFVYYVFKNFGYTLNPGASTQMDKVTVIKKAELVPGDLVFFNNGTARRASHVGIYIGNNQFIHAVSPGNPVTISSLDGGYYSRCFVGGGRVLPTA